MEKGEEIVPFSALAVGDSLFMEEHAADTPAESFRSARHTVAGARGAQAYGFCYDGFIEVDSPQGEQVMRDCLIAEGGTPGADYGHAIGMVYRSREDGTLVFDEEPIYVAKSLNYMAGLGEDNLEVEEFTQPDELKNDEQGASE